MGAFFIFLPAVQSEVTKTVTEKKVCPSKQQCVELGSDIVSMASTVAGMLTDLLQSVLKVQKKEIVEIQQYVDGDRDCLLYTGTKKERITLHEKKKKIQEKLYSLMAELNQIVNEIAQL